MFPSGSEERMLSAEAKFPSSIWFIPRLYWALGSSGILAAISSSLLEASWRFPSAAWSAASR